MQLVLVLQQLLQLVLQVLLQLQLQLLVLLQLVLEEPSAGVCPRSRKSSTSKVSASSWCSSSLISSPSNFSASMSIFPLLLVRCEGFMSYADALRRIRLIRLAPQPRLAHLISPVTTSHRTGELLMGNNYMRYYCSCKCCCSYNYNW